MPSLSSRKVRVSSSPVTTGCVPGARLAAVFLMGLDVESSAEVMRQLKPDEFLRVSEQIAALESQPGEVSDRYDSVKANGSLFQFGGADGARHLVECALAAELAMSKLESKVPHVG